MQPTGNLSTCSLSRCSELSLMSGYSHDNRDDSEEAHEDSLEGPSPVNIKVFGEFEACMISAYIHWNTVGIARTLFLVLGGRSGLCTSVRPCLVVHGRPLWTSDGSQKARSSGRTDFRSYCGVRYALNGIEP